MLHNLPCTIVKSVRFRYIAYTTQSAPIYFTVLQKLTEIWEQFPTKIMKNAFTESSYGYENGTD